MIAAMRVMHLSWLLALSACASEPQPMVGDAPAGEPMVIHLLDDGFVEIDGRRATVEDAVYDLRVRCRQAGDDPDRRPWLRIVAPVDAADGLSEVADRLRSAAYDAGVHHLEFELEER